jgi:tetratricopeptide (TPR) repeat protein
MKSLTEALLQTRKRVTCARFLIALVFVLALPSAIHSQCSDTPAQTAADATALDLEILQLVNEKSWSEVVRLAAPLGTRSADVNFAYGMALAHMQRWAEARDALLAGRHECPHQQRFSVELAGIAFQSKRYPESARWLRGALSIDPQDQYANNFAGSVYLLMGNMDSALKYWNRVGKPEVAAIHFDSQLQTQRLILDRAFAFSPAAVLQKRDYETTRARLGALGIFSAYNIVLAARSNEKFDVEFHAAERNGFGSSHLQALVSALSGVAFETVYPGYYNIGGRAINMESLLRWDSQKRRAWLSVSAPLHDRPEWRANLQLNARNERWDIRNSFTGVSPVLASFSMDRQSAAGSITSIPNGRLQWSAGGEVSNRRFHNVVPGSTVSPILFTPGIGLKAFGSIESTVLDVPERRFAVTTSGRAELARLWPAQAQAAAAPHFFAGTQGSATLRWFPQAEGDKYEVRQNVRGGHIFNSAPVDELYLLGMERDTDLWLRGHVGTRDGRKGSSPLTRSYFLSNSDFLRRVYGNGLISIKAGPLLDIARSGAAADGTSGQWFFDTGAQLKVSALGTSIVFTWGYDLRTGNNAFYGASALH